MRLTSNEVNNSSRIKVQIKKFVGDKVECKHITSSYKIEAFFKQEMDLSEGQVVLVEFRQSRTARGGAYVVIDDLMEEVDAKVLEAQHMIADGLMYTSIIAENPETKKRMHSLVSSSNKLFAETSVIMKGDNVRIRVNNGVLFSIKY